MARTTSKRVELPHDLEKGPSYMSLLRDEDEDPEVLRTEPRKYWEVYAHCDSMLLPQMRREVRFENSAADYHHQRLTSSGTPDQHKRKLVTQAHNFALTRLNHSKLQVRNFILPVQLMKMKHMDPLSRQKTVEDLSRYFSFQHGLRNIVLEQAELKFKDLCRLLVAIAMNSKVKCLYLWHVLDSCEKPFEGPLQSDTILDDLPRTPYTYNPGGKKYLRELKKEKNKRKSPQSLHSASSYQTTSGALTPKLKSITSSVGMYNASTKSSNEQNKAEKDSLLQTLEKLENIVIECLADKTNSTMTCKIIRKELVEAVISDINEEHVFSQAEVGVQCTISEDDLQETNSKDRVQTVTSNTLPPSTAVPTDGSKMDLDNDDIQFQARKSTRLRFCEEYLKYHEHIPISFHTLREIYRITLSTLIHLTRLSVNYSMLADGTGNTLLTIGSVAKGRLRQLKLLCEPDDIPSPIHQLYDDAAMQAIPDLTWHTILHHCPDLRVDIVCVSMSAYDITKRFVTKSMPLSSFHVENGFCPTLAMPELTIFCTLKCLWIDHPDTLENVNLTLVHSTGRIDSSLEKLIQNTQLISFIYNGPLQYKATINKLCDAALDSPNMSYFKLMVQGDPCFPHIARELTRDLSEEYKHKFMEKSINFELGTFGSWKKKNR